MSYEITKQIRIVHEEDDWDFTLTTDEYGSVNFVCKDGLGSMARKTTAIFIPNDCIQNVIDALEALK